MMMKLILLLALAALAAPSSRAAPDEASGVVVAVLSGDVFEVQIVRADPRTGSGIETVKLAAINLSGNGSVEGKAAEEFIGSLLMDRTVWLDIDEERDGGRDPLGRLICVAYLEDPDGRINLTHPVNRILVDEGFALVGGSEGSQFDPTRWWPDEGRPWEGDKVVLINEVEANPDGSDEGNEWVELYNPGPDDVDIGGWTVTSAGGSVVSIYPGTIIPTGGFIVVASDGYWLRNSQEMVILRDDKGEEVDRTPALDDDGNDDYSWSRYPDGGDEWVYIVASPGSPVPSRDLSEESLTDEDFDEDDNWLIASSGCSSCGLWDISDFLI